MGTNDSVSEMDNHGLGTQFNASLIKSLFGCRCNFKENTLQ